MLFECFLKIFFADHIGLILSYLLNKYRSENPDTKVSGFSLWKGNHILIEFPTMVSNARVRLQIDALGFKLRCTVSGHFLPETAVYH